MTQFVFTSLVNDPHADVVSAALGVDASNKLNDSDIGKPVILGPDNNYVLCADGDDIHGFLVSTEAATVNDGFSFGSVLRNKRLEVQLEAGELGTAVAGTSFVVAGIPLAARGTKVAYAQVIIKAAVAGASLWRVIRIVTGTGVAGDRVLIEKV